MAWALPQWLEDSFERRVPIAISTLFGKEANLGLVLTLSLRQVPTVAVLSTWRQRASNSTISALAAEGRKGSWLDESEEQKR